MMIAIVPVVIALGHLSYGADSIAGAQWFVFALACCVLLTFWRNPPGRWLTRSPHLIPPAASLLVVLLLAAFSLFQFELGPPDPIRMKLGVSSSGTINQSNTLLELGRLTGLALAFLLGLAHGERRRWAQSAFRMVLVVGVIYGLIAVTTYVLSGQFMVGGRLAGGFLSANSVGLVFGMLTVLALAQGIANSRNLRSRHFLIPIGQSGFFFTCLIMTASRAGLTATLAGIVLLLLREAVKRRRIETTVLIGSAAVASALIIVLLSGNDTLWRRFDLVGQDFGIRAAIFDAHWKIFALAPLTGYGLGTFTELNNLALTPQNYGDLDAIRAAHNVYLQWLEEAGVLGASAMFFTIGAVLFPVARKIIVTNSGDPVLLGVISASVVALLHGTADFGLQIISIASFWAYLLGLGFARATRVSRRRRRSVGEGGEESGQTSISELKLHPDSQISRP